MFSAYQDDRDYEMNAREDYVRELEAEMFDHWWDVEEEEPENLEEYS